MIMVFKIVTGIMDSTVSCNFISSHSITRGNRYKLTQKHVHYNLTTLLSFLLLIELFLSGIVCQTMQYLQVLLEFLKNVQTSPGEIKIVCITGKPLKLESESETEVQFNVFVFSQQFSFIMRTQRTTLSAIQRCGCCC